MQKLKVKQFEDGCGVILPLETLTRLKVEEGSTIFLVELAGGGYALKTQDPEFETQIDRAEDIMARYRNTLRILAE